MTYVINGSRMRVKLVHEKMSITFQMDGVRAPNAERTGGQQNAAMVGFKKGG